MIPVPPQLWLVCLIAWHAGVPSPFIEQLVRAAFYIALQGPDAHS